MKILVLNYEWPEVTDNCGGGGRIGQSLIAGLRDRGHKIRVVTSDPDWSYYEFPFRSYYPLCQEIEDFGPDLIHGQFSLPSSLALPQISRKYKIPYVVSAMGADVHDPTRYGLIRPFMDKVNESIFRRADRVVVPSRDMAGRVQRKHPGVFTETIHYGIGPDKYEWSKREKSNPFKILTVARLVERKNLDIAIQSVKELRGMGVNAEYTIVGKGELRESLEEKYGHLNWLDFEGYVDDLEGVYQNHHAFFLPSKHEAFGVVFLEALSSGLPVVTSNTGGQVDILNKAGQRPVGIISPTIPEELAESLLQVIEGYHRYHYNTLHFVDEHFSRERMADEYEELFKEVVL